MYNNSTNIMTLQKQVEYFLQITQVSVATVLQQRPFMLFYELEQGTV